MKQSIGVYWRQTMKDLKKNMNSWLILLVITILPIQVLLIILDNVIRTPLSDSSYGASFSGYGLLNFLLLVAWVIFQGAFLSLLSKDVKADDYKKALKNGNSRFWPLLGVAVVSLIFVVVGTFFLVLPGIYLGVSLIFVGYAVVLEKMGVGAAISRSFELVRGRWWKVLGRLIPMALIGLLVWLVIGFIPTVPYLTSAIGYLVNDALYIFYAAWIFQMYLDAKKSPVKKK